MSNVEERIEEKVKEIMDILEIEKSFSNSETPKRIAKMLNRELFKNRNDANLKELTLSMKLFVNPSMIEPNPVKITGIKFSSMCEHHWMPFFGECDIEYIPSGTILGLSKFPRVVKYFSRRPQLQEQLTDDIGAYLKNLLNPEYIKVTLRGVTHTCVSARGIEAYGCETTTVYERGVK